MVSPIAGVVNALARRRALADDAVMQRLPGLDALRGIAAMCVVMQHAMEKAYEAGGYYGPILHGVNLGRFGVILFFLISGFVIPPTIEDVRNFAVNRAFRLLPALWLSIAALTLDHAVSSRDMLLNMTMLAWYADTPLVSSIYWTLSVELLFYVFCAILFAAGQLRNSALIAIVAVVLAFVGMRQFDESWVFPAFLLAGMLARQKVEGGDVGPLLAGVGLAIGLAIFRIGLIQQPGYLSSLPMITGMLLPIPVFIVALQYRDRMPWPWLVWLGTISYSIYLFQDVALRLVAGSQASPAIVAALLIPLSAAVYYLVESPGIALGRRFSQSAVRGHRQASAPP